MDNKRNNGLELGLGITQDTRLMPLQVMAIRMLEMSGPQFEDVVRARLDEDPAIEVGGDDGQDAGYVDDGPEAGYGDVTRHDETSDYDADDDNGWDDGGSGSREWHGELSETGESLAESLEAQMRQLTDDERTLTIARYVIGNLSPDGYLERPVSALTDDLMYNGYVDYVEEDEVRAVLDMIRGLEPAGVAATDLRECLLIQARRLDPSAPGVAAAVTILEKYFDLYRKRHLAELCAAMHIDGDELARAERVIRSLNPKPASGYDSGTPVAADMAVTPDFEVERDDDTGRLTLTLLSRIPHMVISRSFEDAVSVEPRRGGNREYVKRRVEDARDFIRLVEMRNNTLYSVMSAIMKLQRRFFETDNVSDIRPMILKDVAAEAGYDQSTVSRATSNKYVQTAGGIFPLKIFFGERTMPARRGDDDGADEVLTREIREAMTQLIEGEDKRRPLNDRQLQEALEARGLTVARRTVAKYRESLRIPVARMRRQL